MGYLSDIEIARNCKKEHILTIAERAGIDSSLIEQYGNYKAKIDYINVLKKQKKDGKLILVTAITPTPAGEGKGERCRLCADYGSWEGTGWWAA